MRPSLLLRSRRRFIGFNSQVGTLGASVAIGWPAGTGKGDLAVFFGRSNSAAITPSTSGWASLATLHMSGLLAWKVLTAADLAATVNMSNANSQIEVWVFRGATVATTKGAVGEGLNTGVATLSVTGFTKNARSRVLVAIGLATSIATNYSLSSPSLGLMKAAPTTPQGDTTKAKAFYLMPPDDYVNGTGWTINCGSSAWAQNDFVVIELTD